MNFGTGLSSWTHFLIFETRSHSRHMPFLCERCWGKFGYVFFFIFRFSSMFKKKYHVDMIVYANWF